MWESVSEKLEKGLESQSYAMLRPGHLYEPSLSIQKASTERRSLLGTETRGLIIISSLALFVLVKCL